MVGSQREKQLIRVSSQQNGITPLRQINLWGKIYKRSATLLTVLLCSATFAALEASGIHAKGATILQTSPTSAAQQTDNQNLQQIDPTPPSTSDTTSTGVSSSSTSSSSTTVVVNGKSISVPANGSYHQTTTTANGSESVNVDHTSNSSGSGQNTSSVNVNIDSQSGDNGN